MIIPRKLVNIRALYMYLNSDWAIMFTGLICLFVKLIRVEVAPSVVNMNLYKNNGLTTLHSKEGVVLSLDIFIIKLLFEILTL